MADYTASQVREMATNLEESLEFDESDAPKMLQAYAARLDQDAARPITVQVFGEFAIEPWKTDEQLREEGRQSVYREIAALVAPIQHDREGASTCLWCRNSVDSMMPVRHEPDCLWLRAQAVSTP